MTGIPDTPAFSTELREETASAHRSAETTDFARHLVAGERPLHDYISLLGQLVHVYEALERPAATLEAHPVVGPFVDHRLHRLESLHADLASLGGAPVEALPATAIYAMQILETADRWPAGWVAHHYTRYLGDLSGGQLMARSVRRAFGLEGTTGTTFFHFDGITSAAAYKKDYRERLNAFGVAIGREERGLVVEEARWAFAQNQALFTALAALGGVTA